MGDQVLHKNIKSKSLKNLLKAIWPEKLKLLWKHPQVVWIQVCSNYGRWGQGGTTKEDVEIYIFKNPLEKHSADFIQNCTLT